MAGFGWSGAAQGAGNALQEMLATRRAAFLQQQALARQQQLDEAAAAERRNDEEYRRRQETRQTTLDAETAAERARQAARQTQQDEIAATGRRQQANQAGVRRMIGDAIVQRGGKPLDAQARQTLQGMAVQEDVDLPASVTTDPNAELADYEKKLQIAQRYQRPTAGPAPNYQTLVDAQGNQRRVPDGQQVNDLLGQGWKLFDAVAARSSKPENSAEAIDTAREVQRLAGALGAHKGFGGVFGKYSSMTPQLLASQDTLTARTVLNSLKGLLTMENMGKMKGVLSDSDMRILQQASTTLAPEMDEASAAAELNRLGAVMSKLTGEPWAGFGGATPQVPQGVGRASGAGPAGTGFRVVGVR